MILLKLMARRGYPVPEPLVRGYTHTYDYPNGLRINVETRSGRFSVYYTEARYRVIAVTLVDAYRLISGVKRYSIPVQ